MPTTTNYGWTTPADTDLVKDGASAIRTLGSSIDTTTKNLNPQTTTGAIAYRSSTSNVNTSLPLGTAGQVLTVNSGATAPEWATAASGGMTLLSTTTLSGASTTISSISQSYQDLYIMIDGVTNATANGQFRLAPNAQTANTSQVQLELLGSGVTTSSTTAGYIQLAGTSQAPTRTDATNVWWMQIRNYAAGTLKPFQFTGWMVTGGGNQLINAGGTMILGAAISSLVFSNSGGNLSTGTVKIWGVK